MCVFVFVCVRVYVSVCTDACIPENGRISVELRIHDDIYT